MNDQSNNAGRTAPEPQDEDFTSDQAIENAALAGAAAVQRLVAERNNLRNRLAAQQREIATMRAFNEELRRRLYVIHQRYVEVAKRVVGNLEQFDASLREVLQEGYNGTGQRQEPRPEPQSQAAASLVRRLAETEVPLELESESDAPQADAAQTGATQARS
jgi:regulator of replication initiation timing